MNQEVLAYNIQQSDVDRSICDLLMREISSHLPEAENKIWHGSPVWFLDGNPIVGYHKLKNCVRLLFWSGQSFNSPGLKAEGSFKAAEARYTDVSQVDVEEVRGWLAQSCEIQWDYKNIRKRRGELVRL